MSKLPKYTNTLMPYLKFKNVSEAISLYEKALGTEERMRLLNKDGHIFYAELDIGDSLISLGTCHTDVDDSNYSVLEEAKTVPINFMIYVEDVEKAFKRALHAGMTLVEKIEKHPWGFRMGCVQDRYNIIWSFLEKVEHVPFHKLQKIMMDMEQ